MLDSFGAAGDELRELRGKLTRLIVEKRVKIVGNTR